jgi:hypothetical protein
MSEKRRKRGRPPKPMPEQIPDTPEAIARACMQGPPKPDWDYLEPGSEARVQRHDDDEAA